MLIVQIALGIILALVILAVGGALLNLLFAGLGATLGVTFSAWETFTQRIGTARWPAWWNRQRPGLRVVLGLGAGALLVFVPGLWLAPPENRIEVAAMLIALTAVLLGAGWALNWINARNRKIPAAPKAPDA